MVREPPALPLGGSDTTGVGVGDGVAVGKGVAVGSGAIVGMGAGVSTGTDVAADEQAASNKRIKPGTRKNMVLSERLIPPLLSCKA
jgi:tetrahydrodipicolinate N-succinyltransferase